MNARRLTALLLALCLLSACGGGEDIVQPSESSPSPSQPSTPAPRVEFALAYDHTASLDPLSTVNSVNLDLSGLVYEGLFQLDGSFAAQPLLCASYSVSMDGLSWTFHLRSGVRFSDGTPLTAAHVAASLNTARSSELYAARLAQVTAVTAGETEVTVYLAAPNGSLPALLDIPIVLPQEEGAPPLGTGPYAFDLAGAEPRLRQNPHWHQPHVLPLEAIPLRAVSTAGQRIAAFDAGLITAVASDLTASNALGYSGSYESWSCPTTSMLYLGFRCDGGLCADPVLRQAISRAIDRSVLAETVLAGQADAAVLPLSPASALYDRTLAAELDYSLSAAVQLLADGGYVLGEGGKLFTAAGAPAELTLLVNTDNSFRLDAAEYLAGQLAKLGLTVTVTALPWESFLAALAAGQFDLYLAQLRMTADFDLSPLLTGELNYGRFTDDTDLRDEDPGPAAALLSAARASSGNASANAFHDLYAYLASAMPFAPLCFTRTAVLTQWGMADGVGPTQQDPFYQFYLWSFT